MLRQGTVSWTEVGLGGFYLVVGGCLLASASALPAASGEMAGPGFFPMVIGTVMLVLSILLIAQGLRGRSGASLEIRHSWMIGLVLVLTLAYLLMWGHGYFPLRTFLFVMVFLRVLGESWKSGISVAAVLTTVVTIAFQYGLRLSLD